MSEQPHRPSPLPVRLIAFAVLALIALAAIVVIDGHVMARADHTDHAPAH